MEQIDAEIAEITERKQDGREEDEDHRETGNKEENEKEDDGNKGGGNVIVVSADEAAPGTRLSFAGPGARSAPK